MPYSNPMDRVLCRWEHWRTASAPIRLKEYEELQRVLEDQSSNVSAFIRRCCTAAIAGTLRVSDLPPYEYLRYKRVGGDTPCS